MSSLTTSTSTPLRGLIAGVREVTRRPGDWQRTVDLVTATLARNLPSGADVLAAVTPAVTPAEPAGEQVRSHVLHVEPDGSFSIVALILRPGQETVIHDHVTWCAVAVVQGREREDRYTVDEEAGVLRRTGSGLGLPGEVSGFTPPGDIHRVGNIGDGPSISVNVYGTDVSRIGSSVRRTYPHPVR